MVPGSEHDVGAAVGAAAALPHVTVTSPIAASPVYDVPRSYSKLPSVPVVNVTVAVPHPVPWLPDLLHTALPERSSTESVPIVAPYIEYSNVTLLTPALPHEQPT